MIKFLTALLLCSAYAMDTFAIDTNDTLPLSEAPRESSALVASIAPARIFLGKAADEEVAPVSEQPMHALQSELQKTYTKHRIEIHSLTWMTGITPQNFESIKILEDRPGGEVRFEAIATFQGIRGPIQGFARYSAMRSVPIATTRIPPGERLQTSQFKLGEVDVASGINREYRGLIISEIDELKNKETKLTILEGAYVLSTAVQKVPDVRRGDIVSVRLTSGGVAITAPAVAQENGFIDQNIKVLTSKTKKEFQGKIAVNGVVEVKL